MNFTIGLIAGALDCIGDTRIRDFFYCLPMHSGRRADGFDWMADRYSGLLRRKHRRN